MQTAYLVTEYVMYEGMAVLGAYSNPEAAAAHLRTLQGRVEEGYISYAVDEWELQESFEGERVFVLDGDQGQWMKREDVL